MTTVIWRNGELVADSRRTCSAGIWHDQVATKIETFEEGEVLWRKAPNVEAEWLLAAGRAGQVKATSNMMGALLNHAKTSEEGIRGFIAGIEKHTFTDPRYGFIFVTNRRVYKLAWGASMRLQALSHTSGCSIGSGSVVARLVNRHSDLDALSMIFLVGVITPRAVGLPITHFSLETRKLQQFRHLSDEKRKALFDLLGERIPLP